jgi:AcrR family transcriptional regulator
VARTLDPTAHALRRDEFIDAAQRLMTVKGYDALSIQDVLADLGASKGAFYHYFGSKEDLLDAVVERMADASLALLAPIVDDPDLDAIHKFEAFFSGIAQYKAERREFVLGLLRTWISDDNAIVRERLRRWIVPHLTPVLAAIIRQGRDEGVFDAADPDATARVLVALLQGANENAVELYVAHEQGTVTFDEVATTLDAYRVAFERLLGAPAGSIRMAVDRATLQDWFEPVPHPLEVATA